MAVYNDRERAYQNYCSSVRSDSEKFTFCTSYVDQCYDQIESGKVKGDEYVLEAENKTFKVKTFEDCVGFAKTLAYYGAPKGFAKAQSPGVAPQQKKNPVPIEASRAKAAALVSKADRIWEKGRDLIDLAVACDKGPFGIDPDDLRKIYNDYAASKPYPSNLERAREYNDHAQQMFKTMIRAKSAYQCIEERGSSIGCDYREYEQITHIGGRERMGIFASVGCSVEGTSDTFHVGFKSEVAESGRRESLGISRGHEESMSERNTKKPDPGFHNKYVP